MEQFREAYIYKGKNEWYIRYWVLNPETGLLKDFTDRGGLNKIKSLPDREKAANALKKAINQRLHDGWTPWGPVEPQEKKDNSALLIQALNNLVELKKGTLRRRSWQSYKYSVDYLKKYLEKEKLSQIKLSRFNYLHAMKYYDYLLTQKLANKSVNTHIGFLKSLFYDAIQRKLIKENPFKGIKQLPVSSGNHFAYNEEQKRALKKKILSDDPNLWRFVKVIYHCFIRPVEILRLRVMDIDLKNRQIIIPSVSSKNKKTQSVVIPESFLPEIKSWNLDKISPNWYLFSNTLLPGEKSYTRNRVSDRHSKIRNELGIDKRYDLYSWKHTGNVDSYRAGVPVVDIMRQNRHASLDETMNYLRSLGLMPNVEFSKKAPKL